MPKISYKVVRIIHLYAGLMILSFLLMYAITGLRFFHNDLFPNDKWSEWTMRYDTLKTEMFSPLQDYAYQLQDDFDLPGRVKPPEIDKENHQTNFNFESSNTQSAIVIPDEGDSVMVWERTNNSLRHKLNYLHVTRGYDGGAYYFIYALFVDLTIISIFLFAITGIILWYKAHRKDYIGWVLLAAGLIITFGQVIYFMSS